MFDLNTVYGTQGYQVSSNNAHCDHSAIVLPFPYNLPKTTQEPVSVAPKSDIIEHRMNAPLCSNEMTAIMDMVKYRAKHLGQELWVTTSTFLTTMGIDELGDLRRCDFVRAVEYLVTFSSPVTA